MAAPKTWLLRELGVIGLLLAIVFGAMGGLAYGAWYLFNRFAPDGFSIEFASSSFDDGAAARGDEAEPNDAGGEARDAGAAAEAVIDDIAPDQVRPGFAEALRPATGPPPPSSPAEARRTRALVLEEARRFLKAGNPEGAAGLLANYLAVDEGFPLGHRELGRIFAQQGAHDEAIQHFERYLALMPQASDRQAIQKRIAQLGRKRGSRAD